MLCSSEQLLMGRILDTQSSYKGDNAPQNILKIKCPRLAKNAFATQHLLHHSIIYTFVYYHTIEWKWMHFWAHSYRTGKILSIGYKFLILFPHLYMGGPKGLLQTADSIFIKFVSCKCKKASQTKRSSCFKAKIWNALNQCSNSENNEIWMKINWQCRY
jgi:hypothetical protein